MQNNTPCNTFYTLKNLDPLIDYLNYQSIISSSAMMIITSPGIWHKEMMSDFISEQFFSFGDFQDFLDILKKFYDDQ